MNGDQDKQEKRRHWLITGLILSVAVVILGILGRGLTLTPGTGTTALTGKQANSFSAVWLQGQEFIPEASGSEFTLDHVKKKPLILNFWASWCLSCQSEARVMEEFWREHQGEDFLMLGIAIQDTEVAAREFAKYHGKTYPLGLDTDGKSAIEYGVTGVPETFFIDRNGVIQHKEAGPVSRELLDRMLPVITASNGAAVN